jgi:hypothetical protein
MRFDIRSFGYTVWPQSPLGVLKNCGAQTNWAGHMRFVADYSESLEVFFCDADRWNKWPSLRFSVRCISLITSTLQNAATTIENFNKSWNIQCVHKVHSGFWTIVACKQIELATCGLRQITAKLWKFLFSDADRWNKRPSLRLSVSCLWLLWRLCRTARFVWDGFLRRNQSAWLNEITAHSSISNLRVTMH